MVTANPGCKALGITRGAEWAVIVLHRISFGKTAMRITIDIKGQVTIPRDLRRRFGLRPGMVVNITVEDDHIAVRLPRCVRRASVSGFALIQSQRPGVPAEFDVAVEMEPSRFGSTNFLAS